MKTNPTPTPPKDLRTLPNEDLIREAIATFRRLREISAQHRAVKAEWSTIEELLLNRFLNDDSLKDRVIVRDSLAIFVHSKGELLIRDVSL